MKIVIIHGQSHAGSTCHIARMLAEKLGGETTEFFLPRDFGSFCVGCNSCFAKDEALCPHHAGLVPIIEALDAADVIVLASPVYVYHASGPMKAFLDHFGYRWMVHRPAKCMFTKQGVAISTAAGGGMKRTNRDLLDQLFFWGVGKRYAYGRAVYAVNWAGVKEEKKAKIDRELDRLAGRIRRRAGHVRPGIKTRAFFSIMRSVQKRGWCEPDVRYWRDMGWTGKERPWITR